MTEPYDKENIFAKILRGEMPSHKIYENKHTFAFMDIMPRGDGHALVIPKAPARNLLDADIQILNQVHQTVQLIGRAAMSGFSADGLTIQQFNEPAGGQIVFHYHVHVIPRFEGVKLRPHTGDMEEPEILAANAQKYIKALEDIS